MVKGYIKCLAVGRKVVVVVRGHVTRGILDAFNEGVGAAHSGGSDLIQRVNEHEHNLTIARIARRN